MTRTMFDAWTVANLPDGGDLYAGYVDGGGRNVDAIRKRFPGKRVVEITVTGTTPADVIDVEKGDVTPEHAPAHVLWLRSIGRDPTVYCEAGNWSAVILQFNLQRVAWPHWWIAHYEADPTIPNGAVAKQYRNAVPPGYDVSSVADGWPDYPIPPVQQPTEYPDVPQLRSPLTIPTDDQGNGYADLVGIRADHVSSIVVQGLAYETDPAQAPHTYQPVADEITCYQVADRTRVKVVRGTPHLPVQVYVWSQP